MPCAVQATSAATAILFAKTFHPNPPPDIIAAESESACSAPEQPVSDSEPQSEETQTELARANRIAILEQLSASIAEVSQPISAVVMNAEAALRLLLAQPIDTEAVSGLLACHGSSRCRAMGSLREAARDRDWPGGLGLAHSRLGSVQISSYELSKFAAALTRFVTLYARARRAATGRAAAELLPR
jgi:hypothetical protein